MNTSDSCASCSRKVYVIEKVEANNRIYHKNCFKVIYTTKTNNVK